MKRPPAGMGRTLRSLFQAYRAAAEPSIGELGMSFPMANILIDIGERDGISSAELARRVLITPQSMNEVVTTLEDRGFIERRAHVSHGRILTLHLTGAGRNMVRKCLRAFGELDERMLQEVGLQNAKALSQTLQSCLLALLD